MNIEKLRRNEARFLALTSLKVSEFDYLLSFFEPLWLAYDRQFTLEGKVRKTKKHKPRPGTTLGTPDMVLLFILIFLKNNTNLDLVGEYFNMSKAKASIWARCLEPILNRALAKQDLLPVRDASEIPKRLNEGETVYLDGTERPIERSTDDAAQKEAYSGKEKRHTLKNNLLTNAQMFVIYLSITVWGSVNDVKICQEEPMNLPEWLTLYQDLGYVGHCPKNITVIMPFKKEKNKDLTEFQKLHNQQVASERIPVEHVIGGVKRLHIVSGVCRIKSWNFKDSVMETACGLHNFRTKMRNAA